MLTSKRPYPVSSQILPRRARATEVQLAAWVVRRSLDGSGPIEVLVPSKSISTAVASKRSSLLHDRRPFLLRFVSRLDADRPNGPKPSRRLQPNNGTSPSEPRADGVLR